MSTPKVPPKAAPVTPPPSDDFNERFAAAKRYNEEQEQAKRATATAPVAASPKGGSTTPTDKPVDTDSGTAAADFKAIKVQLTKTWDENKVLDAILTGDHFIDNPLNQFDNVTPHWRFFAMPDIEYLSSDTKNISQFFQNLDQYKQVIIAESGITNFNIQNVSMSSVFGNAESRSSQMTEMSMEIKEPGGVQFLDALADAAYEAGVNNYRDYYYFLELTFKGYERSNHAINTRAFSDLQNGGRWLWAVIITNIDVNMTGGGGQYKLSLLPRQQEMLKPEYQCLLEDCVVKAMNVGELFDALGEKMTTQWQLRFGTDTSMVTHRFEIHGLPVQPGDTPETDKIRADLTPEHVKSMMLVPKGADYCVVTNESMQEVQDFVKPAEERQAAAARDGDEDLADKATPMSGMFKQSFTFTKGQDVSGILDIVFSSCEAAQYLAKDSSENDYSADDKPEKVNDKGVRETVTWQIIPDVKFRNDKFRYDVISNRYARDITWHIYPRINHNVVLSRLQIHDATKLVNQQTILTAIAARGFLSKRYDYLFTGQNTEVLSFDLAFNFSWQAVLPRFENQFSEQPLTHALYNEEAEDARWQSDPMTYYQDLRDSELAKLDTLEQKIEDFNKDNEDGIVEVVTGDILRRATKDLRTATEQRVQAASTLNTIRATNPITTPNTNKTYEQDYIESIREVSDDRAPSIETYRFRLPIATTGGDEAKAQLGIGGPSQYHAGKSLYGAVLNQAYGLVTGAFQKITMSVRGDPFWLGEGSYEQSIFHDETVRGTRDGKLAHNSIGYNCFMLRFKYPLGFDASNQIRLENNETVSGIYQVTGVKTSFSGGQMRHELTAIRVPLVDLFTALTKEQATDKPLGEDDGQ